MNEPQCNCIRVAFISLFSVGGLLQLLFFFGSGGLFSLEQCGLHILAAYNATFALYGRPLDAAGGQGKIRLRPGERHHSWYSGTPVVKKRFLMSLC